jgi:glycosyltransferase involved in cell wall biosynthesis
VQPIVTVITPTYNHAAVIGECIKSVLSQTYPKWEMIIVDDGSTDGTGDVVATFTDVRIRYVKQENKGVERLKETYNTALDMAQGKVIGILEGDDYWPASKLASQVPDFDNPNVVLSSGFTQIMRDGKSEGRTPVEAPSAEAGNNKPIGRAALSMMQPDNLTFTFPVSTMIRTSTLRSIGGFQQPSYLPLVDFPTFLRLSIEGEFRFHDDILGYWRRHGQSVTQGNLSAILENAYRYAFEFIHQFRDRIPASDLELDALEKSWDEVASMRCILRGRLLASQGKKEFAYMAFHQALSYHASRKTKTYVWLAKKMIVAGLPVNKVYESLGRTNLHDAITLSTGDQTVSPEDMKRPRVVGRWRSP